MKELENKIREALPRLQELSFGCEFKILNEYIPIEKLQDKILICTNSPEDGIVPWEGVSYTYKDSYIDGQQWYFENKRVYTKNQHIYDLFNKYNYCNFESRQSDFIEVIGHPIKLNDVLEWCSLKTTNFFIEDCKAYFTINCGDKNEQRFYWELSSVFLADQSEELIKFLNYL